MTNWSLPNLLRGLHDNVQQCLKTSRDTLGHPVIKGDASEDVWLKLLVEYLPTRYQAARAVVVDSKGCFSDQIDVVIFDRQYSPFVFNQNGATVIPAESVYAVFEAKQTANATVINYAQSKAESVRALHRTSRPIPHASGVSEPKSPGHILAGILTLESDWTPPLGIPLQNAVTGSLGTKQLDLGCIANHGIFSTRYGFNDYKSWCGNKAATAFLFELIAKLQELATVPMIDIRAYARWIDDEYTPNRVALEDFFSFD